MAVLEILGSYQGAFLAGLGVTLKLCFVVWTAGLVAGSALGVMASVWPRSLGRLVRVVTFTLTAVPILVFLFWLHYPLQALLQIVVDPFLTAAAALSIVNAVMVSDVVRHAIDDFPGQYLLAARACGLSSIEALQHIQAPIIGRQVLPGLVTIQVSMLQATLFASMISVDEIFRVAQRINSIVYRPVEIYTALALFFLAVCLPLNGLAAWLKRRFTWDQSER